MAVCRIKNPWDLSIRVGGNPDPEPSVLAPYHPIGLGGAVKPYHITKYSLILGAILCSDILWLLAVNGLVSEHIVFGWYLTQDAAVSMASWRILLVAFCVLHRGNGQVFESSPGLIKVEEGEDVELRWHTTVELRGDITFYHTSYDDENKLYKIIFSTHYKHGRCNDSCEYLNGERESGIKIPNVRTADAGKYFIQANNRINDDAVIYVFQKPNKPLLTSDSDEVEEGDDVKLTCNSSSNSLPADNRSNVTMNYLWKINGQDYDECDVDVCTITGIRRENSGFSFACIASESGSRMQSDSSERYILDVQYAPGAASIQGDGNVVAGDDITLTCSTVDRGNPEGTYKWKKPNRGTQDGKNLNIENLNVDGDEGNYECYVENDVAQGTSATHTLTVNSVPGVERNLDSEKSVVNTDDSFSVSCAFRAKPAASVVWKRKDDSALPSHIFSFSSSQEADGKFNITTSTLTWSGTDADARRGQGGKMFCEADNGIRDPVKSNTMDLTIQSSPGLKKAIPVSQKHGVTEGASVYFFVEALSNPIPDFQWKRTFNNGTNVNLPSDDSGNKSNLTITNIKMEDFGNYTVSAQNLIGRWEDVEFELRAVGKPHPPTKLSYEATAISLTLSWTPGWDGGPPQTFTITYSTDGFATKITKIPDSPDSGRISYKLSEGISTEKAYSVAILAINSQGSSEVVSWDPITTPDYPLFTVNSIRIEGEQAMIKWTLDKDLADRVLVKAADTTDRQNYIETNVSDFEHEPIVAELPSALDFVFNFSVYKQDDLLVFKADVEPSGGANIGLIIGVVVGIIIALSVVAFFVIQKFRKPKSTHAARVGNSLILYVHAFSEGDKIELDPKRAFNSKLHQLDEDGELTVDNDLYTGSRPRQSEENGELYAEVGSNTKKPKSKKKKFALKPGPDDIYAQIDKAKKSNMQDEDGELTVDNDLYTGSRPHQSEKNEEMYAEVGSKSKNPKDKKKKVTPIPGSDDTYAQVDKAKKSNAQDEDGQLTVDNDLYTGSRPDQSEENGEMYTDVGSKSKKPKDKKKKVASKPGPDDTYAQVDKAKKSNAHETHHDESIYQNCEQTDEEIYANADHANQFVTDDGVVYIEVEFGAESDSNVIRGVVEDVEYAQVDLTKI
ncbi:hypothetical protein CAPTEDRAFT_229391 [Capitella teleta]|uniref:Uncharacterized protein n=1 Tax=Capitella teleta TaxID=283909 RepID=R7VHV5_CAPTE|nr:hypothetical protein CAPTEDRAFT_229391 [Capitella teleta]|eukprot:ELU18147.1 hypothetical protein CAPTEDRAFT_229391 [Capitella teleta]